MCSFYNFVPLQLPLPQSPALSRESHIAVAISVCPHLVEVVMFGGSSTAGGGDQSPKMAKTTVMLFGRFVM